MNTKKELCRNFLRGSCQYGARCKFLHSNQPQQKSNNAGFGAQNRSQPQQQQQSPNPFGFGVQNNNQLKGVGDFGSKDKQYKPFENKWSRSSSTPNGNAPLRQSDNQPQGQQNHRCTDAENCKRQIAEDFQNERPLWKLTCYGHNKNAPCDIVGDISYEELRVAAYDDAKRGLPLQSIVERERNLLNSKLIEFEKLLKEPYVIRLDTSLGNVVQPQTSPFMQTAQNVGPPSVSSFGQLGSSLNIGNVGPPSLSSFGQLGSSLNIGQQISPSPVPNIPFGKSNFPASSETSGAFGMTNLSSGNSGSFVGQQPSFAFGKSFLSNQTNFSNSFPSTAQSNSGQNLSLTNNESLMLSNILNSSTGGSLKSDFQRASNPQPETGNKNQNIWLKTRFSPGEIPEEAPPDSVV